MYKSFTADDLRAHCELPDDYTVDGFLVFGASFKYPYDMLRSALADMNIDATYSEHSNEFLAPIQDFVIDGKRYWFVVAYGGALLSEYLHLASMFGSQMNILLGNCGGLKRGGKNHELIIPDATYGEESSAKAYQPDSENVYYPDQELSDSIAKRLSDQHVIHSGKTITYQAMLGETAEDITNWSKQGYVGVEMEASTVFAVSSHFNVPAAAVLQIMDNLIEGDTMMDVNYENSRETRHNTAKDMFVAALSELIA